MRCDDLSLPFFYVGKMKNLGESKRNISVILREESFIVLLILILSSSFLIDLMMIGGELSPNVGESGENQVKVIRNSGHL
ncbi:hypothetical protein J2Z52_001007 [Enterococcus rivorum]|uniref:Uncharacterized protein n=2 Tax=Enterococcus rivorum TaxID=762845 RepID=A0A1E5KSQ4_9ENTE|nr:hypothetical protein [Enterococcus rivorum]OEH80883.1 hypothetical protein BCR26_06535 [Enterococcus rivorum]